MNVREVEQAVAGHSKGDLPDDPIDPRLVRKSLWLSVRPETEVLFRDVKQALDRERGERLDDDAVLEALCRAYLSRTDRAVAPTATTMRNAATTTRNAATTTRNAATTTGTAATTGTAVATASDVVPTAHDESGSQPRGCESTSKADGAAPYRVAVTVCKECKRGWQHGGGLVTEMSPAALERAQCDAQWIGDLDSNVVERARQEISAAMRRKVLHRDQKRSA
jgi:hypothetical protein